MDIRQQLHKALEDLSSVPPGTSGGERKASLDEGLERANQMLAAAASCMSHTQARVRQVEERSAELLRAAQAEAQSVEVRVRQIEDRLKGHARALDEQFRRNRFGTSPDPTDWDQPQAARAH